MKKTAVVLVLAFTAGCSDPPPKPPEAPKPAEAPKPPPAAPKPAKPNMAPPLSDAQQAAVNAAFATAKDFAAQADKLKADGALLEKSQGRAAANATYVKAKELYHKAVETMSDWTDGDLAGKVSDAQVKDYLGVYTNEVGKWQRSMSDLGKLHD